jgi:hypothetical protein
MVSESGEMCFLKPGNVAHQNVIQKPEFQTWLFLFAKPTGSQDGFYLKMKNDVVLVSWKNYAVCQSIAVN